MQEDTRGVVTLDAPACAAMQSQTRGQVIGFGINEPVDRGVTVSDEWVTIAEAGDRRHVLRAADVPLPGEHNLSNVMAAIGAGHAAGVEVERMAEAVRQFKAVEHRLEPIGTFNGGRWDNDSKTTKPDSPYKTLAAFSETLLFIARGRH